MDNRKAPKGKRKSLLTLLFLFFSCHKADKPYITAFLMKSIEEDTSYYKEIYIYNRNGFSMIPLATINDTALPLVDFHYHHYLYSEDRRFTPGKEYRMTVTHSGGKASSTVFVPSDFSLLKPEPGFILYQDSSLSLIWQKSKDAAYYSSSLYLYYYYTDTLGTRSFFSLDSDTTVSETTLFYNKETLFPPNVQRVDWGEMRINIWAIDGSFILPGAKGNIEGDGWGFYYGANHSGERYFRIAGKGL